MDGDLIEAWTGVHMCVHTVHMYIYIRIYVRMYVCYMHMYVCTDVRYIRRYVN